MGRNNNVDSKTYMAVVCLLIKRSQEAGSRMTKLQAYAWAGRMTNAEIEAFLARNK